MNNSDSPFEKHGQAHRDEEPYGTRDTPLDTAITTKKITNKPKALPAAFFEVFSPMSDPGKIIKAFISQTDSFVTTDEAAVYRSAETFKSNSRKQKLQYRGKVNRTPAV